MVFLVTLTLPSTSLPLHTHTLVYSATGTHMFDLGHIITNTAKYFGIDRVFASVMDFSNPVPSAAYTQPTI